MADSITVSIGITKNIGNYESLRLDASATVEIKKGESKDDIWKTTWEEVDAQLQAQLLEVDQELGK